MIDHTRPPGTHVLLYDGDCKFCRAGASKLLRLARPGAVDMVSFQDPHQLARFPGLTHEECMKQMILVKPDGKLVSGVEAGVQALCTRPFVGFFARVYYIPGLRQLLDRLYAFIAARRYRIMGKVIEKEGCDGGTCSLHVSPPSR